MDDDDNMNDDDDVEEYNNDNDHDVDDDNTTTTSQYSLGDDPDDAGLAVHTVPCDRGLKNPKSFNLGSRHI